MMSYKNVIEALLFKASRGIVSRFRIIIYKSLGLKAGHHNRLEYGRIRRADQIRIGNYNTFSEGFQLWPEDNNNESTRISIGNGNYFNRNLFLDACGSIEIGDNNMIGPDVYITDSNHTFGENISPKESLMNRGKVKIGNHCWIGAKSIILKDVELCDFCVIAAGTVVTKSFPKGSIVAGVPGKLMNKSH